MKIKDIYSHKELQSELNTSDNVFLLLYRSGSEQSECALDNIEKLDSNSAYHLTMADVNEVRDIHQNFNINSVPTLLQFKKGKVAKVLKGCHEPGFFQSLFSDSLYSAQKKEQKDKKRVVVYTTPTCPHCVTAKNYLKGLKIPFRDINVAQDQKMAESMVKKSGQQGVPQIEINGKMIVGFNKQRIDELLEIR